MMKRFCMVVFSIVGFLIVLYGCSRGKSGEPSVVEVLTGKTQIERYNKAKSAIEEINKFRREQNQELGSK